jgi:hypothetical protein
MNMMRIHFNSFKCQDSVYEREFGGSEDQRAGCTTTRCTWRSEAGTVTTYNNKTILSPPSQK